MQKLCKIIDTEDSINMGAKMKFRVKAVVVCLSFIVYGLWFVNISYAQTAPSFGGVAINIAIGDSEVSQGDIISSGPDGFKRSDVEYDETVFGVVINAPIISVAPRTSSTVAVISSGETLVRVSTSNGNIEIGDLITTSTTAGVGQKATKGGYVVGKALAPYSDSSGAGLISATIAPSIGGASGSQGVGSLIGLASDPKNYKYLLAAIVGIIVAVGGTIAFIRLITTGVLAIGRNPLAENIIFRGMIIAGGVIAILAIAGGLSVAAIITIGR